MEAEPKGFRAEGDELQGRAITGKPIPGQAADGELRLSNCYF